MVQQQPNCDGVVVVMVPLPAQGHLNPLLQLAKLISSRGLPVHFTGSATHNRQAKDRVHGWEPSDNPNIHFHDFDIPQSATTPTDINLSSSCKYPSHLLPTFTAACTHMREPLGVLLRGLSTSYRRVVVVYDVIMSFAAHEASFLPNAEIYRFIVTSAFAALHYFWDASGKPADEEGLILPQDIPRVSFKECLPPEYPEFLAQTMQWVHLGDGDIYNTCYAIEGRFVDILAGGQLDKKLWTMAPFNPVTFETRGAGHDHNHKCLEWLNKQPPNSVIFVSFGTSTTISDDQITQFAMGLEKSEQRFIWVLRDADKGDIYKGEEGRKAELPNGFEERIKGTGLIVRDWAPQTQILAHPSIGGFLSHCGWNSILESLSMGVPIACLPMHSDHPAIALLVTDVLKVGLLVREWEQKNELLSADTIDSSIRKLMVSDEGKMMRKRAKELGDDVRKAVSTGGTSSIHLESFLNHILR